MPGDLYVRPGMNRNVVVLILSICISLIILGVVYAKKLELGGTGCRLCKYYVQNYAIVIWGIPIYSGSALTKPKDPLCKHEIYGMSF